MEPLKLKRKEEDEILWEIRRCEMLPRERTKQKKKAASARRRNKRRKELLLYRSFLCFLPDVWKGRYAPEGRAPSFGYRRTVNSLVIIKVAGEDSYVVIKDLDKKLPGFVTGGIEGTNSDFQTARFETEEEAGPDCEEDRFWRVGFVPHSNSETQIAVFFLGISQDEKKTIRKGEEQKWLRLATAQQIERAIAEGKILYYHQSAWFLFQEWLNA